MQSFQMAQPTTLQQALDELATHDEEGRVYAGGQDLLYRYKRRLATNPVHLVNLKGIQELRGVEDRPDGCLVIRALTTLGELERSPLVQEKYPVLHAAVSEIASPQIRNLGTVGGNLLQDVWCWYLLENYDCWLNGGKYCYAVSGDHRYYHSAMGGRHCIAAHPSDLAPALIALDATCSIAGPSETRTIQAEALWPGFHWADGKLRGHSLQPNEVLVEVTIPPQPAGARGVFIKNRLRQSWDFALASVAARLTFDGNRCADARIVLGGVATSPVRARKADEQLAGGQLTTESIRAAADLAAADARPLRLNRYKVSLIRGLCRKALSELLPKGSR